MSRGGYGDARIIAFFRSEICSSYFSFSLFSSSSSAFWFLPFPIYVLPNSPPPPPSLFFPRPSLLPLLYLLLSSASPSPSHPPPSFLTVPSRLSCLCFLILPFPIILFPFFFSHHDYYKTFVYLRIEHFSSCARYRMKYSRAQENSICHWPIPTSCHVNRSYGASPLSMSTPTAL